MADVFISYSKPDHYLALKLSALLEAHGRSTWWDASLTSGEIYRERIMDELEKAGAAIVIWSPNSIPSDWVRAEAGRAHQQRKLIPVRTNNLSNHDIPLPFGELHTEIIENEAAILSAIDAKVSATRRAITKWKLARSEIVSWLGIMGAAFSLAAHLNTLVWLASWVRSVFENWVTFLEWLWRTVLFLPAIDRTDAILLSITVFLVTTVFSSLGSTRRYRFGRFSVVSAMIIIIIAFGIVSKSPDLSLGLESIFWNKDLSFSRYTLDIGYDFGFIIGNMFHWVTCHFFTSTDLYLPWNRFAFSCTDYWVRATIVDSYRSTVVREIAGLVAVFISIYFSIIAFFIFIILRVSKIKISVEKITNRFSMILAGFFILMTLNYLSLLAEKLYRLS